MLTPTESYPQTKEIIIDIPQGCYSFITPSTPRNIVGLGTIGTYPCNGVILTALDGAYSFLCHADGSTTFTEKSHGITDWIDFIINDFSQQKQPEKIKPEEILGTLQITIFTTKNETHEKWGDEEIGVKHHEEINQTIKEKYSGPNIKINIIDEKKHSCICFRDGKFTLSEETQTGSRPTDSNKVRYYKSSDPYEKDGIKNRYETYSLFNDLHNLIMNNENIYPKPHDEKDAKLKYKSPILIFEGKNELTTKESLKFFNATAKRLAKEVVTDFEKLIEETRKKPISTNPTIGTPATRKKSEANIQSLSQLKTDKEGLNNLPTEIKDKKNSKESKTIKE